VCISRREKSERRKFVSGLSSLTSDILKVEDLSLEESKMEDKKGTQGELSSRRPSRVRRGVQCQFCTCNQDMQRGHRWESSRRSSRIRWSRGVQCQPNVCNEGTQIGHRWESSSDEAVPQRRTCGTQMEVPVQQETQTQTESPERACTPPGTPPQQRQWRPWK